MTLDNLVGKGLDRITPDPSAIARSHCKRI